MARVARYRSTSDAAEGARPRKSPARCIDVREWRLSACLLAQGYHIASSPLLFDRVDDLLQAEVEQLRWNPLFTTGKLYCKIVGRALQGPSLCNDAAILLGVLRSTMTFCLEILTQGFARLESFHSTGMPIRAGNQLCINVLIV
jgi:hypothetical protein